MLEYTKVMNRRTENKMVKTKQKMRGDVNNYQWSKAQICYTQRRT